MTPVGVVDITSNVPSDAESATFGRGGVPHIGRRSDAHHRARDSQSNEVLGRAADRRAAESPFASRSTKYRLDRGALARASLGCRASGSRTSRRFDDLHLNGSCAGAPPCSTARPQQAAAAEVDLAVAQSSGWRYTVSPYVWVATITGDFGADARKRRPTRLPSGRSRTSKGMRRSTSTRALTNGVGSPTLLCRLRR